MRSVSVFTTVPVTVPEVLVLPEEVLPELVVPVEPVLLSESSLT